jgi:Penicillin-insensitive murein endopeptidase
VAVRLLALAAFLAALGGLTAVVLAGGAGGQSIPDDESTTESETVTTTLEALPSPPRPTVRWRSRPLGVAVTHPVDWTLRLGGGSTCFALDAPGAAIRAVELLGAGRPRARLLPVGPQVVSRHGRVIAVEVSLEPGAAPAVAAAAEQAAASIELARSGRCHPPAADQIRWRASRPVGLPHAGRLRNAVQLPPEGRHYFTWDPVLHRSPDRGWRRWGTDGVVRASLAIVEAFAAAHPDAARLGIGDLSRPRGGYFGPKHASHQNGLDVDFYYPRKDRKERPPKTASQVDRRLAQDLVNRFVAAGATRIFVGPNVGLTGPPRIVQRLWNHDNHLHARFPAWRA